MSLRRDCDRLQVGSWRVGSGDELGVYVTVELVVDVVVAYVLQWGSTGGALETLNVQVLVLDAHKHTTEHTTNISYNIETTSLLQYKLWLHNFCFIVYINYLQ